MSNETRHTYWLETNDFEGVGIPVHDLLESLGHKVVGGGGVRGDIHGGPPRVEYELTDTLSFEERAHFTKLGHPLIVGTIENL